MSPGSARRHASRDGRRAPRAGARHSSEVRRRRFVLVGAVVLSSAILVAWFPGSALYHQHQQLASTNAQLHALRQQDAALQQEGHALKRPAEVERIARQQYQLVAPGQQAYEILPPSEAQNATAPYPGDPGLQPPAAPDGSAEIPAGASGSAGSPATGAGVARPAGTGAGASGKSSHQSSENLGQRILQTLEFWR